MLDALAATGLRSVRYAKEVPGVEVCRTTSQAKAAKSQENATSNGCESLVEAVCDAVAHMIGGRGPCGVIDLDRWVHDAVFDGAVQAISDGGSA